MSKYSESGLGRSSATLRYVKYVSFGLVLMAPQEGIVSVFILPRVFLEERFGAIRKGAIIWYFPFALSLFLPVLLLSEKGPIVGITLYGYSVVPFLFLSVWYGRAKWRPIQREA